LLLLYDDAQNIYDKRRGKPFSFKSVGVQAQGRTTILKINYRSTRQILQTASAMATELLRPTDKGEDGVPLVQPVSCGRDGPAPIIIDLPNVGAQADRIAELMASAHNEGHAWGDMAVLCRSWMLMDECARALSRRRLPHKVRKAAHDFNPAEDTIKVMTLHVSKGLEFPVVAVMGARPAITTGTASAKADDALEEIRLFYVGATRATSRLIVANAIGQ
jgi:superfamily I DNA/RNA helicase